MVKKNFKKTYNKKDIKKPIAIGVFFILLISVIAFTPFLIKRVMGSIYNIKQADNPNISIETPKKVLLGDPQGWEQYQGSVVYNWDNFIVKIKNDGDTTMTDVAITMSGTGEVTGIANGKANFECQEGTNATFEVPAHDSKEVKCYGAILAAQGYKNTDQKIKYSYKLNGLSAEAESENIHFYQIVPQINPTNVPLNYETISKEFVYTYSNGTNEDFYVRLPITNIYLDVSEELETLAINTEYKSSFGNTIKVEHPQSSDTDSHFGDVTSRMTDYFNYTKAGSGSYKELTTKGSFVNLNHLIKGLPKSSTNGTIKVNLPIRAHYIKSGWGGYDRATNDSNFSTQEQPYINLTIYDKSGLSNAINSVQSKADLYEDEYYDKTEINNAINEALDVYKTRLLTQDEIDAATNKLSAYSSSSYVIPEIPGDYSQLDSLIQTANSIKNEVPNHTDLALYESNSWDRFVQARDAANNIDRNITKQHQDEIDSVKSALEDAMKITTNTDDNGLIYHEGYYDSVRNILNTLKDEGLTSDVSDLSGKTLTKKMITYRGNSYNYYSENSWNKLQNAVNEIGNADLTANEQDQIEAIATDIATSYANLEVAPAIYDYVTEAINEIYNDTGYKKDFYKQDVKTAIDNFIENEIGYNKDIETNYEYEKYSNYKTIEQQDEVDALEQMVKDYKTNNLIKSNYKDADYSELNTLLVEANAMENKIPNYPEYKLYTDNSWNEFIERRNNATEVSNTTGIKINEQNTIDEAKVALENAMQVSDNGLKYHTGYYDSINEILSTLQDNNLTNDISDITNINLIKRKITLGDNKYDYYTNDSWNALVNSVKDINDDLLANEQDSIENKANEIKNAYNGLMPNDAIYDEVIDIINAYLKSDAYKNNWYTNDSKQNYESYITNTIGYDIINKTVTNKLKMDSQETVNGYVTGLNNIQLIIKEASYDNVNATITNYLSSDKYTKHWFIDEHEQNILDYISNTIKYDISNNTFTDKLTIDKQSDVDAYNTELNNLLNDTTKYKSANYSTIKSTITNYLSGSKYTEHWFVNEHEQNILDYISNTIKYDITNDDFTDKLTIDKQSDVDAYNTELNNLLNDSTKYRLATEKYDKLSNEINNFKNTEAWQNNWYVDDDNKALVTNFIDGNYDKTITIDREGEVSNLIKDFKESVNKLEYKKALGYEDSDNYKTNDGYLSINGYKNAFNNLSNSDNYMMLYNDEAKQQIYDYLLIFNDQTHEKMNIKIDKQSNMDSFLKNIKDFYDDLDSYKNLADYSQLQEAMNSINSNLYTNESWNSYINTEAYVIAKQELANPSYKVDEQDSVTTLIDNLINARSVLEYKNADYSEFINAYNSFVNSSDYALYADEYKNQVKAYYDEKIAENVKANEQNKINQYLRILNEKISNPVYRPADYNDLSNEISKFKNSDEYKNNWYINNDAYNNVIDFINDGYDKNITINRQSEITNLVNQFKSLVNNLELKNANYNEITSIINNYKRSDGYKNNWYEENSKNNFENALKDIYDLNNNKYINVEKINKQNVVDSKAESLNELFNNLKIKDANYTNLRKVLAALPNDSEEFNDEITAYINKALNNLNHTIDKQNIVDALVNEGKELLKKIGVDENIDQDDKENIKEIENKTSDDTSSTTTTNNNSIKKADTKIKNTNDKITNFVKIESDDSYESLLTYVKVNNKKIDIKNHPFTYNVKYSITAAKVEVGTIKGASAKVYGGSALVRGNNEITIIVTDSNNKKHYYKLNIIRESTSTYISSLNIKNSNIKFNKTNYEYTIRISSNTTKLNLDIIPEDKTAKVTILNNNNLVDGSVVKIKVEDKEGNKRIYTLNISKKTNVTKKVLTILGIIAVVLIGAKIYAIKVGEMTIYNLLFKKRVK